MSTKIREFESGRFLESLYAGDHALLREIGSQFEITLVARDQNLHIKGEDAGIARALGLFAELETAARGGLEITPQAVRFAMKKGGSKAPLGDLLEHRLLGSSNKPPVVPRNQAQVRYLDAMDTHDVVFGMGAAGSGKTYLAMAKALDAIEKKKVSRIVLTRPAVEAGEALGFLPGDLQEKLAPYLRPLYDALYDMLDPERVEKMIDQGMIEIAPLAYMRGRTLSNAFVILDEAQNTTPEQMFMFLTRIGFGSSCVVTGDPTQTDLRGGRNASGLDEARRLLKSVEGIGFCRFAATDVVRHPVVQRIIEAYSEARENDGSA